MANTESFNLIDLELLTRQLALDFEVNELRTNFLQNLAQSVAREG
jgi:hypothetical protein